MQGKPILMQLFQHVILIVGTALVLLLSIVGQRKFNAGDMEHGNTWRETGQIVDAGGVLGIYGYVTCLVRAEPVQGDRHTVCENRTLGSIPHLSSRTIPAGSHRRSWGVKDITGDRLTTAASLRRTQG